MSEFSRELQATAEFNYPESMDAFSQNIPMAWVIEAVKETGRATVQKRRFPAEQAVWLVLGIGLMRNRSINDVCDKLELAFPDAKGELPSLASSSISKARHHIGVEPLRHLFHTTATEWEKEDTPYSTCGLKILCVDGTQFKVPETRDNQQLGYASGKATFPSVLAVTLMSARTHLISDVSFGPITQSEISYAQQLVGSAPENTLTLFDRGFFSAELFQTWRGAGKNTHWLTPIKSKLRYDVVKEHSPYDKLIDMPVSPQAQQLHPHLEKTWRARLILIPEPKGEIKGFITSMECPVTYPLKEILNVYWERWETETGYSELKQRQLNNTAILRSQTRTGIYQELWGILIAYNLVRLEMSRMAKDYGVEPLRISFINALRLIQDEFLWCSGRSPGTIPQKLKALRESGKRLILPQKRKRQPAPRQVLCKAPRYPYKKRTARA
ncbi:IS4 family transposase [Xenorhabdus bovienii]|uniref:IS4 family transposase n=1 Tax=Xenorhabdus bovienii TaxID=40576 RepID=UPI0023B2FE53|nr:IS4 family transposase [Xenorhabdus bovienii]MDE9496088.1 IS4 family transposase [Xenorhabdus bovienii]MDE9504489.1 IS4 family transposase [Xenorhabdus bovienii]MDE9528228.1 IS4 family transposase [Xenorhabdus bovienii]MDE9571346.1 IS4 family transposase [Xenorhabdus bovienii]